MSVDEDDCNLPLKQWFAQSCKYPDRPRHIIFSVLVSASEYHLRNTIWRYSDCCGHHIVTGLPMNMTCYIELKRLNGLLPATFSISMKNCERMVFPTNEAMSVREAPLYIQGVAWKFGSGKVVFLLISWVNFVCFWHFFMFFYNLHLYVFFLQFISKITAWS